MSVSHSARSSVPLLLALTLAACSGGTPATDDTAGSSPDSSTPTATLTPAPPPPPPPPTTGKVTILLTDDSGRDWDQALATIRSIELIGDDRSEVIFEGSSTVDLLSLPDYYDVFAVTDILPGRFETIRLFVDSLELVDLDDDGNERQRIEAHLVGNGRIDLDPLGDIVIGAGDSLYIEIEFDMNKAFKTMKADNGRVIVRPVILVTLTTVPPAGRLTRLRGTIEAIDEDDGELLLCQDELVSRVRDDDNDDDNGDHAHCIVVTTDTDTGVFGADGRPQRFAALTDGDLATAVGYLRRDDDRRIGRRESNSHFVLAAATVELGKDFQRVAGTADRHVNGDVFDLELEPGQDLGSDEATLATQLYPQTRIFRKDGEELDINAIVPGVAVIADGVLVTGVAREADTLRAALLILDPDLGPVEEVLVGEIVSVNLNAGTLQLAVGTAERCINAAAAEIFLVSNEDGLSSVRVGLGDLKPTQRADVYGNGQNSAGCFLASSIHANARPGNTLPVANAGADVTIPVTANQSINLNGSGSTDIDGDSLSYAWSFQSAPTGSMAVLSGANTATASFVPNITGAYVIMLIVNDGQENSAPDTVTITVQ